MTMPENSHVIQAKYVVQCVCVRASEYVHACTCVCACIQSIAALLGTEEMSPVSGYCGTETAYTH